MEARINKFLADHGVASRRAIDKLILEKRIRVNGVVLEKPGWMVRDEDRITIDGKEVVRAQKHHVTLLLNKPLDCITTVTDTHGRKTVMDYIQSDVRVFPIGRLDKNTTGVLIFTNDGDLAHTLMHPRHCVEKIYRAYIDKIFTDKDKRLFEAGVVLDRKKTAPCSTRFMGNDRRDVEVTLHEGKNRQIRRMFQELGYAVQKLERTKYAGLDVRGMKRGEWRKITDKEVREMIDSHFHD